MVLPIVPEFSRHKHTSDGKEERLDWIISELKSAGLVLKKPTELQKLEIEYFIEEHCRALRMGATTRREYKDQVLFDIEHLVF